jgi:hypothetical protein
MISGYYIVKECRRETCGEPSSNPLQRSTNDIPMYQLLANHAIAHVRHCSLRTPKAVVIDIATRRYRNGERGLVAGRGSKLMSEAGQIRRPVCHPIGVAVICSLQQALLSQPHHVRIHKHLWVWNI